MVARTPGGRSLAIDPTSQPRSEHALLRAILRESPDIVVVRDDRHGFSYLSPSAERILGLDLEALRELEFDLFHPDDLEAVTEVGVEARAAPGRAARTRARIVEPGTRRVRWVDLVATDLADDPAVGGLLVHVRDVSKEVEAEALLRHAERRYQALVEHARDVVMVLRDDMRIDYVTPSIKTMLGYDPASLSGADALEFVHDDDRAFAVERFARLVGGGAVDRIEVRARRASGEWAWLEILGQDMRERDEVAGIVLNVRDVTDRVRSEQGSRRLTDVLGATSDIVTITDRDMRLLYANDAAVRVLGLPDTEDALARVDTSALLSPESLRRYLEEVLPTLRRDDTWTGELELVVDRAAIPMWSTFLVHRDEAGRTQYVSGLSRDMRERKAFEEELERQALHDPLTGLPNRPALIRAIESTLHDDAPGTSAVFFLDLDEFKIVNDTLGHDTGDELLIAVGERLAEVIRPGDLVARLGGDEFVVLCRGLGERDRAPVIAERIVRGLSRPFRIGDDDIATSASVGVAVVGGDPDQTSASLLRDADMAMYEAKAQGKSQYALFDEPLRARTIERHQTETDLRRALERGELDLAYQPMWSIARGVIVGYEALLRWQHPERGMIGPDDFVALAEERGLIVEVGHWVIDRALRDLRNWNARLDEPVGCSINLSARQLHDPSLVPTLEDALARNGLEARLVTLEITESVVMHDVEATTATFEALKRIGIRLSVDDFGTGYSSLAYLRRFPVDQLKVDREFVGSTEIDPENTEIVGAIVRLAHALGLEAVGEGVETDAHLGLLQRLGCDLAQGFHLGRPVTATDVRSKLGDSRQISGSASA